MDGVNLTLAGRGELEPYVRKAESLDPSIRFLGWLTMKELEPLIAEADLIPSLYEPRTKNAMMATPGKLMTAMAFSIPSLVPRGTLQAEIVDKYQCGLAVDWTDVADVRDAIRRLATDRALYKRLSDSAHESFVSSFSWAVMGSRLEEAYATLLAS